MNLITNTAARAAIIALIEGAAVKTRKTTKGQVPARGCLMHRSPGTYVDGDGEIQDRDGAVYLMGWMGTAVQIHRLDRDEPFGVDLIRFYGDTGILTHEEPLNDDNRRWFGEQAARAFGA